MSNIIQSDKIVQGETLAIIRWQLLKTDADGSRTAVDLTGCTLETKYRINNGTQKTSVVTVSGDPTLGIVQMQSEAASWDAPGIAVGRIYITSATRKGISWQWMLEVEAE